jgi:hypothetical protein
VPHAARRGGAGRWVRSRSVRRGGGAPGVMGVRRQGNGGLVVGGVWKKCEKLLKKKKRSSKFFRMEILRLVCVLKWSPNIPASRAPKLISPYALGGAKFISSPWAQKWLATALVRSPTQPWQVAPVDWYNSGEKNSPTPCARVRGGGIE